MTDNNDNTYVFLSHSHLDFDKVSRLRNILEAEGFKPLMFFLKAFENPKYEHLLKPILKEEIDQRQRFILCRSENTKESEWVQFEEEYIKSKRRAYEIIDLDAAQEVQINAIKNYRRRSRVFISAPRSLQLNIPTLHTKLKERGFMPFADSEDIKPGEEFIKSITTAINDAAKDGYVLYLIDSNRDSSFQERELLFADDLSAQIVPIWMSGERLSPITQFTLGEIQILDIRNLPNEEQIEKIVQYLIDHDLQFNKE
ncbi:MAG: toll/interleukin-1 receptor domain-containing protein [Alistipes sp.]|nr:toll/interleukin-1 receptor domain-containing protein [Alistipes sp.]